MRTRSPRIKAVQRRRQRRKFSVEVSATTGRTYVAYVRGHLQAARGDLRDGPQELHVVLVGDRRMSELHRQFMRIDAPTDVLTFPLEKDETGVIAGEVYVCVPEARRRSREMGTTVRHELLLYALHGMLHLSGFDDRTDRQYHRMHRMEDLILRRLGVGPVFKPKGARR